MIVRNLVTEQWTTNDYAQIYFVKLRIPPVRELDKPKFYLDAPHVEIGLGKNISPNTVYEGGDVYFDCRVKAKPRYNRITWMHNVSNAFLNCNKACSKKCFYLQCVTISHFLTKLIFFSVHNCH